MTDVLAILWSPVRFIRTRCKQPIALAAPFAIFVGAMFAVPETSTSAMVPLRILRVVTAPGAIFAVVTELSTRWVV